MTPELVGMTTDAAIIYIAVPAAVVLGGLTAVGYVVKKRENRKRRLPTPPDST